QQISNNIKFIENRDRFVCLVFDSIILINVYLPSANSRAEIDVLIDVLSEIKEVLGYAVKALNSRDVNVVIGGDFNININSNSKAATLINNFMIEMSLI